MNSYKVLGLMSGTSLDGVDLALCVFEKRKAGWSFTIESAETISYTTVQKRNLSNLGNVNSERFSQEHVAYGKFLGELVKDFLKRNKSKADFVASHGHTVFHQPSKAFTTQIGEGAALSAACGLPVVCDFRSADVALGGQGAPLVPIGDKYLFGEYDACLNLGGIANISFEKSGKRIAFDICPVNMVLNKLASEKGKSYDRDGRLALKGKVQQSLLNRLNSVSFYKKPFPKSLGREDVEKHFLRILENNSSSTVDKLRTFCEHIAVQISAVAGPGGSMLVTGGGTFNSFLMSRVNENCNMEIVIPGKQIIGFKESVIFAFLGVLRWRNEVNCLSSVTGALRDSSGGAVYHP
jgi:anhydro-N-acetylmuramic acid kinase